MEVLRSVEEEIALCKIIHPTLIDHGCRLIRIILREQRRVRRRIEDLNKITEVLEQTSVDFQVLGQK